jgi:alginate O-acetyltransferase complex protein AlgI
MLFNSFGFALFFLLVLIGLNSLPTNWRWAWLVVMSLVFYGWSDPKAVVYLIAVTVTAFYAGGLIESSDHPTVRRALLTGTLLLGFGSLAVFKYYDFVVAELSRSGGPILPALGFTSPPGYSFYLFGATAYIIDVYRRDLGAEVSLGRFSLFLTWFPKILAGPIERAGPFLKQAQAGFQWDSRNMVPGLQLLFWGLFKKVVVADNLAPVVDNAFSIAAYAAPLELLIACYFFAFQIYCDFSGYTDMATGASRLMGIRLSPNFRRPYLSASVSEFWASRWHISLGHWFRDYLFIPLGGSRAGSLRTYFNIMLVFLVSGLWHAGLGYGVGWTFLVWGALNGLYQWGELAARSLASRYAKPGWSGAGWVRWTRIVLTFHLILISWIFFRASSISEATLILGRIASGLSAIPGLIGHYPFTPAHGLGAGLILSLLSFEIIDERRPVVERISALPIGLRWTGYYLVLTAIAVLGSWQGTRFIYMQF